MLFDNQVDGIEDPNAAIAHAAGIVNLAPAAWFLPFRDVADVTTRPAATIV